MSTQIKEAMTDIQILLDKNSFMGVGIISTWRVRLTYRETPPKLLVESMELALRSVESAQTRV
jgi:hypothetical protein